MTGHPKSAPEAGFTLIEISIGLVIIGLIVGGILTGQDLISAAAQRAQIAQIEKYNTAVRTFQGKYGYLPGDIPDPIASNFGFQPRGTAAGEGDGDGFLLGYNGSGAGNQQAGGETVMFWVDLSTANLIDGGFNSAASTSTANITTSNINLYFPLAKIGNGAYVYSYNGGYWNGSSWTGNGFNYYSISAVISSSGAGIVSTPTLTVQQASNIDKKIDDGLPQYGNVQAFYLNHNLNSVSLCWAAGGGTHGTSGGNPALPSTVATIGSSTTCYDNGNLTGATQQYSLTQNNGNIQNCALSFKFQ